MNYNKQKADYLGPNLPITLLLAGAGTYENPYRVNFENDPIAKSIVYMQKETLKPRLPLFYENLNTLLSKLSFYKFNSQCIKDLTDIIEWIDIGNKVLFNPVEAKVSFYIFENSYQEVESGSFK